jgi:hypothetical protein
MKRVDSLALVTVGLSLVEAQLHERPVRWQQLHVRLRFAGTSIVRHVADLNNEGIGELSALFKSFADQAGLPYDVALETRGGAGFEFHLDNKLGVIGRRPWDKVVMQGQSMLDLEKPGDSTKLVTTSKQLADFLRSRNPKTELFLNATWSRADQRIRKRRLDGKSIEVMARRAPG